ncbi:MAG: hypothetical protein EOP88_17140 [Verrucomicrobiaceae bacterium]|nr:MAG: hypothetical protein EOP88_17140 [Verrucomicrobiaceae bacterium]
MKTSLIVSLVALVPVVASAKLGETAEHCGKIYGTLHEQRPSGSKTIYTKDGVYTTCWFDDGKCTAVSYQLISTGAVMLEDFDKGPRFTEKQASSLLNLNRGGSVWKQESKDRAQTPSFGNYKTDDGMRQARVSSVGVTVELVEEYERNKSLVAEVAVDEVIKSFSGGADDQHPSIKHDAPLPPPSDVEIQLAASQKRMEERRPLMTSLRESQPAQRSRKRPRSSSKSSISWRLS